MRVMKEHKLTMNIGIISFMSIFIILSIVVFALLSLSSAKSNARLTNKSIQQKEQYYALSSQGEKYLKQIEDALYTYYQSSSSKEEYFTKTKQLTNLIAKSTYKDHHFHFQVKNDTNTLYITLKILYPGDALYEVQTWTTSSNTEWTKDDGFQVL